VSSALAEGLAPGIFISRNLGDVLQRVSDHSKIEEFLTSHSINIVFAMLNLIIFSIIMAVYSGTIFAVFFIGSLASIGWVIPFLNKIKEKSSTISSFHK